MRLTAWVVSVGNGTRTHCIVGIQASGSVCGLVTEHTTRRAHRAPAAVGRQAGHRLADGMNTRASQGSKEKTAAWLVGSRSKEKCTQQQQYRAQRRIQGTVCAHKLALSSKPAPCLVHQASGFPSLTTAVRLSLLLLGTQRRSMIWPMGLTRCYLLALGSISSAFPLLRQTLPYTQSRNQHWP
jgi:hypothetical protein